MYRNAKSTENKMTVKTNFIFHVRFARHEKIIFATITFDISITFLY